MFVENMLQQAVRTAVTAVRAAMLFLLLMIILQHSPISDTSASMQLKTVCPERVESAMEKTAKALKSVYREEQL